MSSKIIGAKYAWFGLGRENDVRYLDLWRDVPLSYHLGQAVDDSFHTDHHEDVIMKDATPRSFGNAATMLLKYQFYPPALMQHVSDFSRENRTMQVGDRVIQRINPLALIGIPFSLADTITMNEIAAVIDEPRHKGFTYITTEAHAEMGEWSAAVEWREDNALVLTISALSRPAYSVRKQAHPIMRNSQKRAHEMGIAHFTAAVLAGGR